MKTALAAIKSIVINIRSTIYEKILQLGEGGLSERSRNGIRHQNKWRLDDSRRLSKAAPADEGLARSEMEKGG
jgi:hypothetical protein